jgi:hypothetical protein
VELATNGQPEKEWAIEARWLELGNKNSMRYIIDGYQ